MSPDVTSSAVRIQPRPLPGAGRSAFPRLVRPEAPPGPRRAWAGALAHSLLEMPWPIWCLFDILIMTVGVHAGYRAFVWTPEGAWIRFGWVQTAGIYAMTMLISGVAFGLYEQQTLLRGSRVAARSILAVVSAALLANVVIHLLMYELHSRRVLFVAAGVYLCLAPLARLLVCRSVRNYGRRFIIVGTDRRSRLPVHGDALTRRYQLAGYVALDPIEIGRRIDDRPVLGAIEDLERICRDEEISEIVVGPGASHNRKALERVVSCMSLGCRVANLSTFCEQALSEVPLDHLEPDWFLFADLKHYRESQLIMKRVFDVVTAVLGLLVTLPLWPVLALLIKLDSRGPVFYSQTRAGLNGRSFRLHKFRTMCVTAEINGHAWAKPDDPRVTCAGRYLRRSRLDELPQLWNVLIGDMSLVGPRPERPEFVDQLSDEIRFYNERHLVKPGLTGWAQIHYRYGASVEDARRKLQLDLWYIKHMSLELDLFILLRTPGTVFLGSR